MIISYSSKMPWKTVDGKSIPTGFRNSVTKGIKVHTFRSDSKERWRSGMKIHHYMGNPRNGGTPFNPWMGAASKWFMESEGRTLIQRAFYHERWKTDEPLPLEKFVPVLDGFERYEFTFDELGLNGTMVTLEIECQHMFTITLDAKKKSVKFDNGADYLRLVRIAENDGLSGVNFLRWFIHSARKKQVKKLTGKILHFTELRYSNG